MNTRRFRPWLGAGLLGGCLLAGVSGHANVVITEFMASNTRVLADEDGEYSDWIEIYNSGSGTVDLGGWSLTDSAGNLTKWRFPSTNLNAGAYLVVFASNKDRQVPGAELHTNFRLTGSGEYLALVEPDGVTIASEFAPAFPPQVADVSYGLGQAVQTVVLVASNGPARVLVPTSDALGLSWTDPAFADTGWLHGTNGVGYEVSPGEPGQAAYGSLITTDIETSLHNQNASAFIRLPFQLVSPAGVAGLTLDIRYDDGFVAYLNGAVVASRNAPLSGRVADSVAEFSGTQGQNHWYYGYYNRSTDGNGSYQASDFVPFPANYWTASIWDWPAGNPPWTELNPTGGHPNGSNNGNVHWAIRRWKSEVNGTVVATIRYAKSNAGCGNGTTGRIFHNGTEVFAQTIAFGDSAGINTTVTLSNVLAGDDLDFAIDPRGTDGTDADGCDGTVFTAVIDYQAPDLAWDSAAAAVRANSAGRLYETIELENASQWLNAGANVLAIQGLNAHPTNADFLIQPVLKGTIPQDIATGSGRYFSAPTPGGPNGVGTANLGPIITDVRRTPNQPLDHENLVVTARIAPSFAPVVSNALTYRVMFGPEVRIPLLDDGLHGDGVAGDTIFGGVIPASAAGPNQMIRYYLTSIDSSNRVSRWPFYTDPLLTPQYLGTVVADPTLTNPLPVLHWFVQDPSAANSDAGTRCAMFFLGEFFDNISINLHGQSSRGFPKKSYDVEFNPGYKFHYHLDRDPVSDVNLLTTYPDKAHMRNMLAYETYHALGSPYHWVEPVRVHQNGAFFGVWHLVENGDDEFVERLGLDPNNPLYKMYNTFTSSPTHANIAAGNAEKKTRKWEGNADLLALLNGVLQTGETRRRFLYDNVDLPEIVNSMAIRVITGDQDCCHKNYYLYRDTTGNREWQIWPWDIDLSWGRRWISAYTYWDDNMIVDTRMPVGDNNGLLAALYSTAEIRQMYWRRQRTLMDEFLQAPGTPANELRVERRIEELAPVLAPDAALDLAKWGTWCCASAGPYSLATIPQPTNYQTLRQAADLIEVGYLPYRRKFLFVDKIVSAGGEIPDAQPADARVLIASVEVNPVSGNQREEYVVLTNVNNYAVDLSGWHLQGGIDFTFKPGTVIPARRVLYVSPDVNAFRSRTTGPRGGQALFVQGNYRGQLSTRGESIQLVNQAGQPVDLVTYPGTPSLAQQYLRVTEIMYHPTPLPGSAHGAEEFEFIELKNIGPAALSLAGVRFTDGIDFDFTGGSVTNLAPGAKLLVVANLAAFSERYGGTVPPAFIAGAYTNALENRGERLVLVDAAGEEILDFEYDNAWHPLTDGHGFSLVVVDEQAEPDQWNRLSQWQTGSRLDGSPGQDEPAAPSWPPVVITEALTRTETPPPPDTIELHHTGTNVADIGGWYLSDDFNTPKKYRIPDATLLPPGGYLVFDESQFNPGGNGFALGADGDEVWLFSGDATGNLTGYFHGFDFGATDDGVSFGRVVTSDGREHFVAQAVRTLGAANGLPRVGPVVITEIMYHPPDVKTYHGLLLPTYDDNSRDEYLEVRNVSLSAVPLYDPAAPANRWKLAGGVDFDFPPQVTLGAGEFVLLVNFDPNDAVALDSFRARYGIGTGLRLFGPYQGKLNNDADDVELKKPALLGGTNLAYVLVDKVDYRDLAPWDAGADGRGPSLQRRDNSAFGNEPANWAAAGPNPGGAYLSGPAPGIASQPADTIAVAGYPASLSVGASGPGPFRYQWRFNGMPIHGATEPTLTFPTAYLSDAGTYDVTVMNSSGFVVSSNAVLSVYLPVAIQTHPQDVNLIGSTNLTDWGNTTNAVAHFSVVAVSESPITYQWRFNGEPIPNATGSTLTVSNVTLADQGVYDVVVSDRLSSVTSRPARLNVLQTPVIVLAPLNQVVPMGGTFTASVQVRGGPPPFMYQWRRGSAIAGVDVSDSTNSVFTYGPVGISDQTTWRVALTNAASPVITRVTRTFTVTVEADFDEDGLPDSWEVTNGFSTNDAGNASVDLDGDGMTLWQEYVAGTDWTDPLSYLRVDRIRVAAEAELEFLARSNRTYRVEFTDHLLGGVWTKLVDVPALPTNRLERFTDPLSPSNRVYRLAVPLNP